MKPLVISRKEGEVISFDNGTEVEVKRARNGKLLAQVLAPLNVVVSRKVERAKDYEPPLPGPMEKMLARWEG